MTLSDRIAWNDSPKSLRRTAMAALFLVVAAASGCGSSKPIHYYQLNPPAASVPPSADTLNATLLVRRFQSSHLLKDDRIIYGANESQLSLYDTQRWSMSPVDLLQDELTRELRSSGRFRVVTSLRSDLGTDYALLGQLYDFREVSANGAIARLHFDVELRDLKQGKTIWRHSYSHDEPSTGKSVSDLVAAMDKNVKRSAQEIQEGVIQAISANTSSAPR